MDRLREQFSRKSGVRRDVRSDEAMKTSVTSLSSPEQSEQIQETAEDEGLYGLKELWPGELRGFETKIEWVLLSTSQYPPHFLTLPNQYHCYPWP